MACNPDHNYGYDEWLLGLSTGTEDLLNARSRALIQLFQILLSRVPSYSTLRRVMMRLDYNQLQTIFNQGPQQYSIIPEHEERIYGWQKSQKYRQ